jgi:DNA-binding GntR family transcriptional regulator
LLDALQRGDERAAQEAVTRDIQTAGVFLKRSGHFSKPRVRRVAA